MSASFNTNSDVPATPITPGTGQISPEWRSFFVNLLNRTGGSQGIDVNNITIKSNQISDATPIGIAVLTAESEQDARTAIGAGTSSLTLQEVASALTGATGSTLVFTYNATTEQISGTISPSDVTAGTYGGNNLSAQITVGKDGRVTSAKNVNVVSDLAYQLGMGL